jgi:RNA polymerase sigma-70 factor, ECF subfamily
MPSVIDTDALVRLHARLLQGDRVASEEIITLLLPPLSDEVGAKFPFADPHSVYDGVIDALLDFCTKPEAFDPARGVPIQRYLAKAAWRNLANSVRGEKRRKAREQKAMDEPCNKTVELHPRAGNPNQKDSSNQKERYEDLMKALDSRVDQEILKLRLRGERRTTVFAQILGILHLPASDQRREVKRAKDRIDVRLKRFTGSRS